MSVGFASTTQTTEQFVDSWIRKPPRKWLKGFGDLKTHVQITQHNWHNDYMSRAEQGMYDCSKEDLLGPPLRWAQLFIPKVSKLENDHGCLPYLNGNCGRWGMSLTKTDKGVLDFTITVLHGNGLRFQPHAIEYATVNQHGRDVYNQWKKLVMDDIGSLKFIIKRVRHHIETPIASVCCSKRSANLCRRVGLPVEQGVAFLLPSKFN